MKACVLLPFLFSAVFSGKAYYAASEEPLDGEHMEYFLVETEPGVYRIEELTDVVVDVRASPSDLTYYFYSTNNLNNGIGIKSDLITDLRNTGFSVTKDTLFIVHGWRNSNGSAVNYKIREAVLARYDINCFVVDWAPVAERNYISAQRSVVTVGKYLADFIQSLVSTFGLRLDRVAFVGHSLGAHVSGNAGAALNAQVDHIVGLDPAYPLFSSHNIDNRLDPSDAKFVQVIHTNGGLLGFRASIGDSDFFPNGGSSQPGCGLDIAGSCAHSRAYAYYAESIRASNNLFTSTLCDSYSNFNNGRCNSNAKSAMGGYVIDRISGDFYLTTNSRSPYARG